MHDVCFEIVAAYLWALQYILTTTMNLPDNILRAIEDRKLTSERPIWHQLFIFRPEQSLEELEGLKFNSIDQAHAAAAGFLKNIEVSMGRVSSRIAIIQVVE